MADSVTDLKISALLINAQSELPDAHTRHERPFKVDFSPQQRPKCISCDDEEEEEEEDVKYFNSACGHSYCNGCLASYVKSALEPSGTFPPVCCKLPITIQLARDYIPQDMVRLWEDKYVAISKACSLLCAHAS